MTNIDEKGKNDHFYYFKNWKKNVFNRPWVEYFGQREVAISKTVPYIIHLDPTEYRNHIYKIVQVVVCVLAVRVIDNIYNALFIPQHCKYTVILSMFL